MSTYVQVTIDVASPEAGVIKEVIHIFFYDSFMFLWDEVWWLSLQILIELLCMIFGSI